MEVHFIKVLFLAPDPSDAARLRLGKELGEIQRKLDNTSFKLEDRWAVRPKDILQTILDKKPQIVHFSGHGVETGELCFENDQGKAQRVTPEALASLFKLVAEHVKCVVINTCYSEDQAVAIAEHIPFVIGMKKSIGDRAAIEFATGFYTALEADKSIEQAFEFGRVAIQLDGILAEYLTPVLIFGDPRNRFLSEVERVRNRLQKIDSISAKIYQMALHEKGKRMGLTSAEIDSITNEVSKQVEEFKRKSKKYEQVFTDALREELPLSEETKEGLKYLQNELGLRDEDTALIENKIISDPRWKSSEASFDRGLAKYRLGEYQEAINYYTQAIDIKSDYSAAYLERGYTCYKLGEVQAAINDYNKAIEINSNWDGRSLSSAYFERGFAYFYSAKKENHAENMQAAIKDWTETISFRSNYSIAYYDRALAYSALDDQAAAIEDFTQAINVNNDWGTITPAHAYYRRGLLYQALGNAQAANQDFQKAVELLRTRPEYKDSFSGYSDVLDYLSYLGIDDRQENLDNKDI